MKQSPLQRGVPLERRTRAKRKPVSPASAAQRMKVRGMVCVFCDYDDVDPAHLVPRGMGGCSDPLCVVCVFCDYDDVDPAHLVPRGMGGCSDPLCVVPLCRACHRLYDDGKMDLLPHLEPHWRPELAHAVEHLGLLGALKRITNERWKVDE